jgi:hypothetical protein
MKVIQFPYFRHIFIDILLTVKLKQRYLIESEKLKLISFILFGLGDLLENEKKYATLICPHIEPDWSTLSYTSLKAARYFSSHILIE